MSPMLLVELAAKSFLVSAAALLLLAGLKRRSAAERSWAAHAALSAIMVLPLASVLLPRWRLAAPHAAPSVEPLATAASSSSPMTPIVQASPVFDPAILLQVVYGLGAGLLLASVFVALLRLSLLRRGAAVVVEAEWLTALARAQRRMGVKYGAALLASNALTSPVSWGMLRPTILLNEALLTRHADAEAIIAHELAHVARFDWAKLLVARVVTALFWFNPLVWLLAKECHQLREEAADDAVLRSEVPSCDYAALLVQAARHECRPALIAAHGVAPGKGSLHQRVTRVLDSKLRRVPAPAGFAFACLAGATLFAGPLAAVTLEPGDAPVAMTIRASKAPSADSSITIRSTKAADSVIVIRNEQPERRNVAQRPQATSIESARQPVTRATVERFERPEQLERPERLERPEKKEIAQAVTIRSNGPLPADVDQKIAVTIQSAMAPGEKARKSAASDAESEYGEQAALDRLGVTPAYIKDLEAVGYTNLDAGHVAALHAMGVTSGFIRQEQKRAGRRLTPEELVERKALAW